MDYKLNKVVTYNNLEAEKMQHAVVAALEKAKGVNIKVMNVTQLTDITDYLVIVSGNSDRHLKTLCDRVIAFMAEQDWQPFGVEGVQSKTWILVDFVDVIVHIMRENTRQHYDLEGLWDASFSVADPVNLQQQQP